MKVAPIVPSVESSPKSFHDRGIGVRYIASDEPSEVALSTTWCASRGYEPEGLFAIAVAGDAMKPGLQPGDIVVVNTEDTEPREGVVFAAKCEGDLVLGRVVPSDGAWWMSYDNSDQHPLPSKRLDSGASLVGAAVLKRSDHV